MKKLRILIVEDNVMARMALETILTEIAPVAVIVQRSVRGAASILREKFDFAFLDTDVADGETFGLAYALAARGVPFAFMTDRDREELPRAWISHPVLSKPPRRAAVRQALLHAEDYPLVA
jgi:DNA-binding response OmpR family regulator